MQVEFLQVKPVQVGSNIQLQMCHGTVCGNSPGTYPDVTLDPGTGSHVIIVSIANPTLGVTFDDDALWVKPNHGSPPHKMLDSAGQIPGFTKANDTTIFFTDANNNNQSNGWLTLGYALRFKGPTGALTIDPDIKNGGGTSTSYSSFQTASLVIGIATLAAILFVAFQQFALKQLLGNGRAGSKG